MIFNMRTWQFDYRLLETAVNFSEIIVAKHKGYVRTSRMRDKSALFFVFVGLGE